MIKDPQRKLRKMLNWKSYGCKINRLRVLTHLGPVVPGSMILDKELSVGVETTGESACSVISERLS